MIILFYGDFLNTLVKKIELGWNKYRFFFIYIFYMTYSTDKVQYIFKRTNIKNISNLYKSIIILIQLLL